MFDPRTNQRASVRLRGFSYRSRVPYFVTLCVHQRRFLFGNVREGEMILSPAGQMVDDVLARLSEHDPEVWILCRRVMPNHVHFIVALLPTENGVRKTALADVVRRFKTYTMNLYGQGVRSRRWPRYERHLCQRSYWEHVIRTESSMETIGADIHANPVLWDSDPCNPDCREPDSFEARLLERSIERST